MKDSATVAWSFPSYGVPPCPPQLAAHSTRQVGGCGSEGPTQARLVVDIECCRRMRSGTDMRAHQLACRQACSRRFNRPHLTGLHADKHVLGVEIIRQEGNPGLGGSGLRELANPSQWLSTPTPIVQAQNTHTLELESVGERVRLFIKYIMRSARRHETHPCFPL